MTIDEAYRILGITQEDTLHAHMREADLVGMPVSLALDRWRKTVLAKYISQMYADMWTDRSSDRFDVIDATHRFDDAVEILTHLVP
jgi:hypothetical protein